MKRQGDLLIVKVDGIPSEAVRQSHRVLAEGEVSGHRHELTAGEVYETSNELFFDVPSRATVTLTHPEHQAITFIPGTYKVIRQREYQPESWRYVQD